MRPERIVHVGMGAFFKAHQAWYTEKADDHEAWGIVAYTGRSPEAAEDLRASGNEYTLITRFGDHDEFEVISSVVRAESGSSLSDFIATVANPATALVTLTITEAGYRPDPKLELEGSALGRLTLGLAERSRLGAPPLALVPCDNMPENGSVLREVMLRLGEPLGADYLSYLQRISFVSTSVDRITPRVTGEELELAASFRGFEDRATVVTEPFADWVLEGEFPLGRPNWESAGARFVAELEPFENRKLWLLNGAHSLISFAGQLRGFKTVDEAMLDESMKNLVEEWWRDACRLLPSQGLDLDAYLDALRERFANDRIGYQLTQIAKEALTKLRVRIAPVAEALLDRGSVSKAAAISIASYITLVLEGARAEDAASEEIDLALNDANPSLAILRLISKPLAESDAFRAEVLAHVSRAVKGTSHV